MSDQLGTYNVFLTPEEIATLTGRKVKRLQIEALKAMGVPFLVNALGKPVVTRTAIEGRQRAIGEAPKVWQPRVLQHAS